MHSKGLFTLASFLFFGLAGVTSATAYAAGLDGSTVSAIYWFPSTTVPPPLVCGPLDICEPQDYEGPSGPTDTPAPTVPVDFLEGAASLSTVSVTDTQITITNFGGPTAPFCSVSVPCPDVFNGFAFVFSSGADITKVIVDPSSAPDFLPIAGGLTFTSTAIFVNLVGRAPDINDQLILDVTAGSAPPAIPEPSTWAMMLLGFAGLGFVGYRRMGGHGRAAHIE